jgi:hypothetical protein
MSALGMSHFATIGDRQQVANKGGGDAIDNIMGCGVAPPDGSSGNGFGRLLRRGDSMCYAADTVARIIWGLT